MPFPVELTMTLTGATRAQLAAWRSEPNTLLTPEIQTRPIALYSFRDIVALRTVVFLRSQVPLQRVRVAFRELRGMNLTDHPSRYKLTTDGGSVFLVDDSGATDLVRKPGQRVIAELAEVFQSFSNFRDQTVVDFLHPRERLEIRENSLGGWPTIVGTRVPYDTVARLQQGATAIPAADVSRFYPKVTPDAAVDALNFDEQVRAG